MLAMLFLIAHARHGFLEARACLARRDFVAAELGIDARDARLRGFQAAALALQLTCELGNAAMRDVKFALRVVAMALGLSALRLYLFVLRSDRFDAILQGLHAFAQRMDFLLAREHARLRAATAQHTRITC